MSTRQASSVLPPKRRFRRARRRQKCMRHLPAPRCRSQVPEHVLSQVRKSRGKSDAAGGAPAPSAESREAFKLCRKAHLDDQPRFSNDGFLYGSKPAARAWREVGWHGPDAPVAESRDNHFARASPTTL